MLRIFIDRWNFSPTAQQLIYKCQMHFRWFPSVFSKYTQSTIRYSRKPQVRYTCRFRWKIYKVCKMHQENMSINEAIIEPMDIGFQVIFLTQQWINQFMKFVMLVIIIVMLIVVILDCLKYGTKYYFHCCSSQAFVSAKQMVQPTKSMGRPP